MKPRVNMHDIAKRAKVSLGTVSHVMNGSAVVREPLRQRVLEAVQALGYQPSQLARGLRRDYTNMMGMIIPDILNPFFPALVRAAEDVAYAHGYRLVLCNSDNDPQKEDLYLSELQSYLPAGLLIIPAVGSNMREAPQRNGRMTPTVCIDRRPEGWNGDVVRVGNEEGAYQVTMHLIDHGHRRIAVVTGPLQSTSAKARLRGSRKAMKEMNLSLPAEWVVQGDFDRASGLEAGLRLLRPQARPTAVVAGNDLMAMGVLLAIRELGLRCPEDISVVGFDNLDATEVLQPPLTTVQQPVYELGRHATRLLLQRIAGAKDAAREVVLETELIRRNSVMRVPPEAAAPRRAMRAVPRRPEIQGLSL